MAIENNLCENCIHAHLCVFKKVIDKFADDAKHPMGIDINMNKCSSYEAE